MFFSANEILAWRKAQLNLGGRAADIDWLIDIGGGLGWDSLQKLKVFQDHYYELQLSLEDLSSIWLKHLTEQIPLQYLLGKCPWRDFELEVNPSVLIPRQETELLIEIALKKFKTKSFGRWADLGTGSGALAIALARALPFWEGHAVDLSKEALDLAAKNLSRLAEHSKIDLSLGNWWDPLKPWWGSFDLVLANPPYVPNAVFENIDPIVRNNEPREALCGGDDGMDHCREIIRGGVHGLRDKGWLVLEHHFDQSERMLGFLIDMGFEKVSCEKDLEGVKRFALGRHP